MLNASVGKALNSHDGITATHIYTHRNDADKLNSLELAKLPGLLQRDKLMINITFSAKCRGGDSV